MFSRRFLRIKVVKALYAHFKSNSDSMISSEKNLIGSIDKSYDLYLQMLYLVVDVKNYAQQRIELGRNKKLPTKADLNPNMAFVENAVVMQIDECEQLNKLLEKKALGWHRYPELIKHLYNKMIESDYYVKYMSKANPSFNDDKSLVESFYVETVQDDELLEQVVEEQSILWCDDIDFALIMILRTLESCKENQTEVSLRNQYKNEDDLTFTKELFRKTIVNFNDYQQYIERFTQNWDVERIAYLDSVILACAMAELISFDSIPVKVTLDEYIEISKYYSTPSSSQFINGILDKIVASLQTEGKVQKTGRGLME